MHRGQALGIGLLASFVSAFAGGCAPGGSDSSSTVSWRIVELEALTFVPEGQTRKAHPDRRRCLRGPARRSVRGTWAMWDRAPGSAEPGSVEPFRPDADAPGPDITSGVARGRSRGGDDPPRSPRLRGLSLDANPDLRRVDVLRAGSTGSARAAGSPQRGSANTSSSASARATPVGAFEREDAGSRDLRSAGQRLGVDRRAAGPRQGLVDDRRRDAPGGGREPRGGMVSGRELPHPGAPHLHGGTCLPRVGGLGRSPGERPGAALRDGSRGLSPRAPGGRGPLGRRAGARARVGQRWGPSASTLLARLQREGAGGAWVDALLAGASR